MRCRLYSINERVLPYDTPLWNENSLPTIVLIFNRAFLLSNQLLITFVISLERLFVGVNILVLDAILCQKLW